jgi:hypothetical protein
MALAKLGEQEPVGETVAVAEIFVSPFEPQHRVYLCWEGELCLRGHDLEQNPAQLNLVLYWQSKTVSDESYVRYVHLVDSQDGRVAAQSDAIPRDWSYPTDIWEADEIVADHLSLPLDGVPPGSYELHVGWYTFADGRPLMGCPTGDCREQESNSQLLTTIMIP